MVGDAGTPTTARPIAKKIAGKKLVLEYDKQAAETVAQPGLSAQNGEDPAIARARVAYTSGNQRLFAGDADGAIKS